MSLRVLEVAAAAIGTARREARPLFSGTETVQTSKSGPERQRSSEPIGKTSTVPASMSLPRHQIRRTPSPSTANETRREFLRIGALAGATLATGALPTIGTACETEPGDATSPMLDITISGYEYDHVRSLIDGRVGVQGCNPSFQPGKIGDLNTHVFSGPRTLDVTEVGLSPFLLAYANDDFRAYSLIPVFPLRLIQHKSVFIHADRGIERPDDLKGRRVGTPGYSSTSLTWIRGFMQHEHGVSPQDIEWVVSAADSSAKDSGKASAQKQVLREGTCISVGPVGKDEFDLLLDGDVDALFHAAEPKAFAKGNPNINRLFTDPRATEREYFARTGIFPIMHAVAMRNDLIDDHPWLPEAVLNAYSRAKQLRYEAMGMGWLLGTLPWFGQELFSALPLRNVVLLSPDLDTDIAAQRIGVGLSDPDLVPDWSVRRDTGAEAEPDFRRTIYTSPKDRALLLSRILFRSYRRVGRAGSEDLSDEMQDFFAKWGISI